MSKSDKQYRQGQLSLGNQMWDTVNIFATLIWSTFKHLQGKDDWPCSCTILYLTMCVKGGVPVWCVLSGKIWEFTRNKRTGLKYVTDRLKAWDYQTYWKPKLYWSQAWVLLLSFLTEIKTFQQGKLWWNFHRKNVYGTIYNLGFSFKI